MASAIGGTCRVRSAILAIFGVFRRNTVVQTTSTLAGLREKLVQLGLTFADVVQAKVCLVGDPTLEGRWTSPA